MIFMLTSRHAFTVGWITSLRENGVVFPPRFFMSRKNNPKYKNTLNPNVMVHSTNLSLQGLQVTDVLYHMGTFRVVCELMQYIYLFGHLVNVINKNHKGQ